MIQIAHSMPRGLRRFDPRLWCGAGVFAAAGGAAIARKRNAAGGGGPTTTPSWIAKGTESVDAGTADTTPAYGTNASADLFMLCVYVRNVSTPPTVSGWTLQDGPDTLGNSSHYWFTRDTRSSGSESGTITVNARGTCVMTCIHTFRNVATSSFFEDLTAGGSATDDTTVEAPQVDATGNCRLAVACGGLDNNNVSMASFTGESGGDWVQRQTLATAVGSNATMWLQTAALDTGGTISGGSHTLADGRHWVQHGFALIGV